MIKKLSQQEYQSAMSGGISDVTETAEPEIDIWMFVEMLVSEGIVPKYVLENFLVEKVYRSLDTQYDHILLPTAQ